MKPDYDLWDRCFEYPMMTAAWLCCDMEPPASNEEKDTPERVTAMLESLLKWKYPRAWGRRNLQEVIGFLPYHAARWNNAFTRKTLRKFAEETGQRKFMPFLFPEDRPSKNTQNETLYEVIRALSIALSEAHPDTLKKKDGRPLVGSDKPGGTSGIVGHLIAGKHTHLKSSCLEGHISRALKSG